MNHWAFVTAAYVVALGGTAALTVWAWATMRKAETPSVSSEVER